MSSLPFFQTKQELWPNLFSSIQKKTCIHILNRILKDSSRFKNKLRSWRYSKGDWWVWLWTSQAVEASKIEERSVKGVSGLTRGIVEKGGSFWLKKSSGIIMVHGHQSKSRESSLYEEDVWAMLHYSVFDACHSSAPFSSIPYSCSPINVTSSSLSPPSTCVVLVSVYILSAFIYSEYPLWTLWITNLSRGVSLNEWKIKVSNGLLVQGCSPRAFQVTPSVQIVYIKGILIFSFICI